MWDEMGCWELGTPGHLTSEIGSGSLASSLWATPCAQMANGEPEAFLERKRRSVARGNKMGVSLTDLNMKVKAAAKGMWPTIRKSDGERGGRGDLIQAVRGNPNSHFKMPTWPTPRACMTGAATPERLNDKHLNLEKAVAMKLWPTPKASAAGPDFAKLERSKTGISLATAVVMERFPTPTNQDAHNNGAPSQMERNALPLNAVAGGALNPVWVEWLMGCPLGWTDLRRLEMGRFQGWLRSHGGCCFVEKGVSHE